MIYIIVGIFFFVTAAFTNKRKPYNVLYKLQCLVLILLSGLRNRVGGDTIGYMMYWDDLPTISELYKFDFLIAKYQPLWYFFNAIVKFICNDFTSFQILHAIIVNVSIFYFINKYSRKPFTAIFFYYLITFPYFNYEILRESLAVSVFLFAIPKLIEKKWLQYYLLCFVAFLFHSSAIIVFFLPLLKEVYGKLLSVKTIIRYFIVLAIFLNSFVLNYMIKNIFPFLEYLFTRYYDMEWSFIGVTIALIKFIMLVLLVILRQKKHIYLIEIDGGIKLYMFFSMFALFLPIGQRLQNYFVIFLIIGLAELFHEKRRIDYVVKKIVLLFFLATTIQYYFRSVSKVAGTDSRFFELFYPYYSVFEEVPGEIINKRESIYFQEGIEKE